MILITLIPASDGCFDVVAAKGAPLGQFEQSCDGFYYYWPADEPELVCWEARLLREIADKLDELNKPWADQLASEKLWITIEPPNWKYEDQHPTDLTP